MAKGQAEVKCRREPRAEVDTFTSKGEILYLNFLSYADLFLDCCVSLILRREDFFLITYENSIFYLKTVSVYIKRELLICEH